MGMTTAEVERAGLVGEMNPGTRQGPWHGRWPRLLAGLSVVIGAVFAGGCSRVAESRAAVAPPSADVVVAPPPPPPPSVAGSSAFDDGPRGVAEAPARSRPGLGTEWGEERESPVFDIPFRRWDDAAPLAVTELRYDDERGVRALAAYAATPAPRAHEWVAAGGAIAIWLKDEHENPLDVVQVGGQTFVVGEAGQRYTIVMENHTGHRFETVATVDGLDVINGKPGALRNRGYLLLPYATLEIEGFRETEQTVAAFRFGRVADAYAAKVGEARDVGVIGMAFFGEHGDAWTPRMGMSDELRRRVTATPFPGDRHADPRFAPPPPW